MAGGRPTDQRDQFIVGSVSPFVPLRSLEDLAVKGGGDTDEDRTRLWNMESRFELEIQLKVHNSFEGGRGH